MLPCNCQWIMWKVIRSMSIKFYTKKNHICFENTPRRSPTIHIWCRIWSPHHKFQIGKPVAERQVSSVSVTSWRFFCITMMKSHKKNIFWPSDLDLWPMTLTFELDLDILPLDLHIKIQGCGFDRSALRARYTHRQTIPKLLHPSLTLGVKTEYHKCDENILI